MEKERVLSDILSENWQHVRHIESERRQFMYIYSLLIGGILTILGNRVLVAEESLDFIIPLALFLTLLSLLGLLWTIKANIEIHNLFRKIENIALCLNVKDKVGLPVEHKISIGELFECFYSLMLAFWVSAIVYLVLQCCSRSSISLCHGIVLFFIVFLLVFLHIKILEKMIGNQKN